MPHHIELFVADCPLCRDVELMLEVGKCAGCRMDVYDLSADFSNAEAKVREYGIRCVPTIVIDGRIKIEGRPGFTFICSDELYRQLEATYRFR